MLFNKKYWDLVRYRVYVDLKSESNQSYLGVLWWIIDPLFYLAAFYLLFGVFMQRGGEGYVGFLLCGLVFWRWFDGGVKRAAMSIKGNLGIISQVYLPKLVFPVAEVAISSYRFLFVLVLFLLFVVLYRQSISIYWLALPILMAVQLILILGVGICISLCVPFLPDITKVLDNVMMFMFFMSGVFFDISRLGETAEKYLSFNPMAVMIDQYRQVFLYDQWPNWYSLGVIAVAGFVLLLFGAYAGKKLDLVIPRVSR